jgi:hypothetical protein
MAKADSVHSTPRKTALKIVTGNDFVVRPPDANALEEPATSQRKRRAMPATEIIHDDQSKAESATAGNGRLRTLKHHEIAEFTESTAQMSSGCWRARVASSRRTQSR